MQKIVVYVDRGVSGDSLRHTMKSLQEEIDMHKYLVQRMDASAIKNQNWEKETALFIIPGGQDVFYESSLGDQGNAKIKQYVERGGSYLGICAGAYFASGAIEFEKGGQIEVCGERKLKFFPGLAVGPAYGSNKYSYTSEKGAAAASILWKQESVFVYFNGGCLFAKAREFPDVAVLAAYDDIEGSPAAIVACPFGKGKAVLTGVHIEYSASSLSAENPYLKQMLPLLEKGEAKRRQVFREVLAHLGISTK